MKPLANLILAAIASLLVVCLLPQKHVGVRRLATPTNALEGNRENIGNVQKSKANRRVIYHLQGDERGQQPRTPQGQTPPAPEQQHFQSASSYSEPKMQPYKENKIHPPLQQKSSAEGVTNRLQTFQVQVEQAQTESEQKIQQIHEEKKQTIPQNDEIRVQAEQHPVQEGEDLQVHQTHQTFVKRPVIYTFWTPQRSKNGVLDKAEKKNHEQLLMAWKELWLEAGWEPRILTLEDSKKHPLFQRLHSLLISQAIHMNVHEEGYDYLCFMRWLAMASINTGGWMSDYDTIPMGITTEIGLNMPNNGRFTSYEGHVPSLLSGHAHEWDRMATAMVLRFENHLKEDASHFYSDMYALRDLWMNVKDENGINFYIQDDKVTKYPYSSPIDQVVCVALRGVYAVHLSHAYTRQAIQSRQMSLPEGKSEKDRHYFARMLTKRWIRDCHPDLSKIRGKVHNF
mmetsp:Transcript_17621/g.27202  ORF Transcript_17621/g.27202 Transcript_17621/m.27202 type:complete len:455 (-) Transcript_17621:355-1719(-)|eukprot:CAMPEP_0195288204 /NCGR_PEP_ID=MMETSP0707-20130614/4963_1 /TAXON_ID=33640 /ORGANISM="Asterionellopsis glacialis, Strain CCMP134" /LENGTH=454 /DNA_ID=CAMNT_0040348039 /DNA_START=8 /DNA_END=1372 /DNA_ORIENTATION=+